MKLVMTIAARDEGDVVESTLKYHLDRGVDFVIATDNNSTDDTTEIFERFAREGHLHLIREPADDYAQERWVTRMARMAATDFGADWVINADADEYFWPTVGSLKDVFAAVPEAFGVLRVPRYDFLPRPEGRDPFHQRMTATEVVSIDTRKKRPLDPKAAHRAVPDVTVGHGNHWARGEGLEPLSGWQPIEILHFPLRTYAQFENKVLVAGRTLERQGRLPSEGVQGEPGETMLVGALYREWQAGRLPVHFAAKVLDDDAVAAGVASGWLARDLRLKRYLGTGEAGGPKADELQLAALRALDAHERRARSVEHLRSRATKASGRVAKVESAERRVAERLAAVEASRWWRAGQRASAVLGALRFDRRRQRAGRTSPPSESPPSTAASPAPDQRGAVR